MDSAENTAAMPVFEDEDVFEFEDDAVPFGPPLQPPAAELESPADPADEEPDGDATETRLSRLRRLRRENEQLKAEKKIDILIIDYIQLLNAGTRSENRQQEMSYISRSLKALAKELDIPIICLSQLSRAPEARSDHRPVLSDLRAQA